MAKTGNIVIKKAKPKITNKGVHSKKGTSNNKSSKLYVKKNRGQGM